VSPSRPEPETVPAVGAALLDDPPVPLQLRRDLPAARGVFSNPVIDTGPDRDHGDPFVLRWQGRYLLYYTGLAGIEVWTSEDLAHWTPEGLALAAPDGDHWAQVDLWAPEVLYADGWFWMYVTGTRQLPPGTRSPGVGVDAGDDALRRQGIARARTPLGPFALDPAPLLDVWSIDGHPFVDVDGRRWLFYNVRDESTRFRGTTPGCGNLVDELVAPDAVRGLPTPVALPDAAWEGNRAGTWYWNEGPTVLRHRERYVQMYSGGWYADDSYGVGFAVADDPRGPWVKAAHNPVFLSGSRITGPGHHCVTVGPDGVTPYAVYHGYVDAALGRKVHVDRLHWSTEGPRIGDGSLPGHPSEGDQPLPDPAVHDPAVPFWHAQLWVRAPAVRLGDVVVATPPDRDALLDVTQRGGEVRVLLDGRLVADAAPAGDPARTALDLLSGDAVDGEILAIALTTWRRDADVRGLAAGETAVVPWGGSLPVEAVAAVSGPAVVRMLAGDDCVAESAVVPGDLPVLVRLRTTRSVDRLEVVAGAEPVVVSDVVLTARPRVEAVDVDLAGLEVPAPRTGVA
jgi:GH43 family beta-xylosidase